MVNGVTPPSVAVLITYYNERELLTECLRSLTDGADVPDEILVYDDASEHPAEAFVPPGLPCRVIRGEMNHGPSYGRNVLLAESRSEVVHFHDSDDLFRPDWCGRVRTAFAPGVDAVFTEIESVREGEVLSTAVLGLRELQAHRDLVRFCIRGFMLVPAGTYRRELVVAQGGYRGDLWQSEDFDFHVRLASSRPEFVLIDEPLVVIRIRRESRSQNRLETWTCAVDAVRLLAREIPAKYRPDLAEKAASAGSALFQLGAVREARDAFALAHRLGPPRFDGQRRSYRIIAGLFGAMAAERVGGWYRALLSPSLRTRLQGRGG